jgi:hypothetical protein
MPFKNIHSCRIREPNLFEKDSFKTYRSQKEGLAYVSAILKKTGKRVLQSFRYQTDTWDEETAKKHCKIREGEFHPAAKRHLKADHDFLHAIFAKTKKGKWEGWTMTEVIKEHVKITNQMKRKKFNPDSELDCVSLLQDD